MVNMIMQSREDDNRIKLKQITFDTCMNMNMITEIRNETAARMPKKVFDKSKKIWIENLDLMKARLSKDRNKLLNITTDDEESMKEIERLSILIGSKLVEVTELKHGLTSV